MQPSHMPRRCWPLLAIVVVLCVCSILPASTAASLTPQRLAKDFFTLSPDGQFVVYFADTNNNQQPELFSAPLSGGPPVQLSPDLTLLSGGGVLIVSPDSQWVVYGDDVPALYSVPLRGGAPRQLSLPVPANGSLSDPKISSDSQWVLFRATDSSGRMTLYRSSIVAGPAEQLSLVIPQNQTGGVSFFEITPDGTRVIYRLWRSQPEIHSVPLSGGASTYLHPGDGWSITNDSQSVVINNAGVLVVVPAVGGAPVVLSQPGEHVLGASLSPDGSFVVIYHHPLIDSARSLISRVPITGGAPTPLSAPVNSAQFVDGIWVTPDSQWVLYARRPLMGGPLTLTAVRPDGADRHELSPAPPQRRERFELFKLTITPDSKHVVYVSDQEVPGQRQLYRVPIEAGPAVKLNPPGHTAISSYQVSTDQRWIVYVSATTAGLRLFSLPLPGGVALELSDQAPPRSESPSVQINASSTYVAYVVYSNSNQIGSTLMVSALTRHQIYLPLVQR